MTGLVDVLTVLLVAPVAYAALCAGFLLFVRIPDHPYAGVLEDGALLLTTPFLVVVLGTVLVRRGG